MLVCPCGRDCCVFTKTSFIFLSDAHLNYISQSPLQLNIMILGPWKWKGVMYVTSWPGQENSPQRFSRLSIFFLTAESKEPTQHSEALGDGGTSRWKKLGSLLTRGALVGCYCVRLLTVWSLSVAIAVLTTLINTHLFNINLGFHEL